MVVAAAQTFRQSVRRALQSPTFEFLREHYAGLGSFLVYHRVAARKPRGREFDPFSGLTVTAERFREQMWYLRENFLCLDLPAAVTALRRGRLPKRTAVVTFDDGYRDNLTIALPILEELKIPATIFVSTGLLESGRGLWWYDLERILEARSEAVIEWRGKELRYSLRTPVEKTRAALELNELLKSLPPGEQRRLLDRLNDNADSTGGYRDELLSWGEVRELDKHPLFTIGAHTVTHPVLSALSPAELDAELRRSRRVLEDRLGRRVDLLAYPYGGVGQASVREFMAAESAGYGAAFTTRFGHIHRTHQRSMLALPRISVTDTDTLDDFAVKLSGLTAFVAQRGRRVVTA